MPDSDLWSGLRRIRDSFRKGWRTQPIKRTDICATCGHERWEHKKEDLGHCDSGHPATNKRGVRETYGSMDWCTCKQFIYWKCKEEKNEHLDP